MRSGTHAEQTGKIMTELEKAIEKYRPAVVVAEGDTNTVVAAALTAVENLEIEAEPTYFTPAQAVGPIVSTTSIVIVATTATLLIIVYASRRRTEEDDHYT